MSSRTLYTSYYYYYNYTYSTRELDRTRELAPIVDELDYSIRPTRYLEI